MALTSAMIRIEKIRRVDTLCVLTSYHGKGRIGLTAGTKDSGYNSWTHLDLGFLMDAPEAHLLALGTAIQTAAVSATGAHSMSWFE